MEMLKRMKFWFALGGVALLALILFVLGPCSRMSHNAERLKKLQDRKRRLRRYASKKVKNKKWVEQQNKKKSEMERQLRQVQEELLSRDSILEEHLSDPETGAPGPLGFTQFPDAYDNAMDTLRKKLEDSVLKITSKSPLAREKVPSHYLSQKKLHRFEKQVQVQRAIVNAIVDLNEEAEIVPIFHAFRFKDKPERFLSPAHAEYFKTIPFELTVSMEFEFYPLFLERLMLIRLGPEMTSVKIRRYVEGKRSRVKPGRRRTGGFEGRSMAEEESEGKDDAEKATDEREMPHDLVFITLNGYIPDYVTQEEKGSDDETETGPERRRRR